MGREDLTLWVCKCVPNLLPAEVSILKTGLILTDPLNHQTFVLLGEAFRAHGRVGHPAEDKYGPDYGENSVTHEEGLPGFNWGAGGDVGESKCQEAADDILEAIHHVPKEM